MLNNKLKNNIVLFFGIRFLKPKNKFLPNISIIMSSLAVSISIAILIIVMSVMNGFTSELIDKILGLNSHISVYSRAGNLKNIDDISKKISNINGVKMAFPVVSGSGMVINNGSSAGVFVKGISKENILENKDLRKTIIGNIDNFSGYKIILGKDIARQLNVKKGDIITMIVPIVAETMLGTIPRQVKLKLSGVIDSHSQQYDNYMAIVPFDAGQKIFSLKDTASAIEVITKDPENIDVIEIEILKLKNLFFSDWRLENDALLHALKVESNVMGLILSLFVIISTFTIFAVIRMMIKTKEREIAILQAHGISNKQIGAIFFFVGIVICLSGMLFGNLFGITFALNIDSIRLFLESVFNTKLLDGEVYLLSNLPSRLMLNDVINTNIFALLMSIFCIYLSVKRNIKIDITKTLRDS